MKVRLIDPNLLTLGDLDDFERCAGVGLIETYDKISASGDMTELKVGTLIALVWVCARHITPDFTLEDARRVRPADVEFDMPDPVGG